MKILIAYATKHGATEDSAKLLAKNLNGEVDLVNLKKNRNIDLSKYDKVIIGSSVYVGKVRKEAIKFCDEHLDKLSDKKIILFTCCMREGKEAEEQVKASFPQQLINNAIIIENLGGEFNFEKMNFMEKMIVKKVAGVEETESNISENHIHELAEKINNA